MLSKLMFCRYESLVKNFLGYQKTGISLIEFNGDRLNPTYIADDIGIYVIIPKIATFFNLAIDQAITIFFFALLVIPTLISAIGFFFLYKQPLQRIISIIGLLLLTRQAYAYGDVYLAYFACSAMIAPWSLYFVKNEKYSLTLLVYTFIVTLFVGIFQCIRSYSGLGALLFLVTLYAFRLSLHKKQALKLIGAMVLGFSMPTLYFSYTYHISKNYAQKELLLPIGEKAHTFWHPIYLGFGFLKDNPDNIEFKDTFAYKLVDTIAPGTVPYSTLYEKILKNKVINLFKNHFKFVLFTIFAKIGIMLFYLLKFANIGLLFAIIYRKPWFLELPFLIGL